MENAVTILALLGFLGGCVLVGAVTKAWTGSGTAGLVAGLLAGIVGTIHAFTAFAQAVGEYEGELTGYDKLVHDHVAALLIGTMAGSVVVVAALHAVSRRERRRTP